MSLAQAIHFDIASPTSLAPHPGDPVSIPPTPPRQEHLEETIHGSHLPGDGQQVFSSAQLLQITKTRRIATTSLIILSNLIQVRPQPLQIDAGLIPLCR